MEKREPSFLKDRPDPKRPKTPLALRSDSLDAEESSKMAFGVKLLQDFDITQFPTKTDVLGRYFLKEKNHQNHQCNQLLIYYLMNWLLFIIKV